MGNPLIYDRSNGRWVRNAANDPDSELDSGFRFFSDGTFWHVERWSWTSSGGGTSVDRDMGVIIRYGNYSAQGNQLLLSNISYDYFANDDPDGNDSGTIEDIRYYYTFTTEDNPYMEIPGVKVLRLSKTDQDADMQYPYYQVR